MPVLKYMVIILARSEKQIFYFKYKITELIFQSQNKLILF